MQNALDRINRGIAEIVEFRDFIQSVTPPDEKGRRTSVSLANALGVKQQAVYEWMRRGKIPAKHVASIHQLAKSLGADIDIGYVLKMSTATINGKE